MRKRLVILGLLAVVAVPELVQAQEDQALPTPPREEFYLGEVVKITGERRDDLGFAAATTMVQTVLVKFLEGPRADQEETIEYGVLQEAQKLTPGQRVILVSPNDQTFIFDRYRLPTLGWILTLFVVLAVIFAG